MVGIDEVARRAGVSNATVSRALSGRGPVSPDTKAKVRAVASELGYVVSSTASGLASGKTKNVGVVVPFLSRWFFSSVLEGAQSVLLANDYDLTLYNLRGRGEERRIVFEESLLRKRVDAVIAVSLGLTELELARLTLMNKPIVGVGGPLPNVPTFAIDDVAVARMATEHLLELGHRAIAHLGGDIHADMGFHVPHQRREGYEAALRDAGIPVDPRLFIATDFSVEGGYESSVRLFENPAVRPTAVVAASDEMAIGTILAARAHGLEVPRDVSVIGIDGHNLSGLFGLTTIAQYPEVQGAMAAQALIDHLGPGPHGVPGAIPMDYDLVVRTSTAPPHV